MPRHITPDAEYHREYDHRRYLANRERAIEAARVWAAANPEKVRRAKRKYAEANREKILEAARKRYAANIEKERERSRKYAATHPEKVAKRVREWAEANRNKRRANEHKRRSLKAGNGGSYIEAEWLALCARHNNQCIGPGPHGGKLQADHVIPVGEPNSTSDISNIQPLCRSCNTRKGHRTIDYR